MSVSATDSELWERQPGESQPAFEAWVIYRDLRTRRSVRAVAGELGKSWSLLSRWSARHSWVKRAAAFDANEDRIAQQAVEESIQDMVRRHVEIAVLGTEAMSLPVTVLADRLREDPDQVRAELDDLSTVSLIRLSKTVLPSLRLAVEMERTARGAPLSVLEEHTTVERVDVEAVVEIPDDPDRLRKVAAILMEAGALDLCSEDDAEVPIRAEPETVVASRP